MPSLYLINGPNLNLLGSREVSLYGTTTLEEINATLTGVAAERGHRVIARTSNHEGAIIDALHEARTSAGVILNAGAFAHTSLAIADAVRAIAPVPVVEVHLTNTSARDPARRAALVGEACAGRIEGFGPSSYTLALGALLDGLVTV